MYAATTLTAPSFSHQNQNSSYSYPNTSISIRMTRPHSLTSPSTADKAAMNASIKKVLHKSVCLPCKTNNNNTTNNNNNNNNNPNNVLKPNSSTSSLTMSSILSASPPKIIPLSSSSTLSKSLTTTTATTTILDCSLPTSNAQVLASPATSTVIPVPQTPHEGITVSQIISGNKTFSDFAKEEFESLRCQASACEKNFYSGLLPQNSWKNRYHNVLPLENSRVCLPCVLSSDSDYINANYIYGLFDDANSSSDNHNSNHPSRKPRCPPTYIACQAPLLSTIGDFWKMIWTEKSPVIVCLTKLSEQGTQKADVYWPECEPLRAGKNFIVSITKKVIYKSIVVRTFLVKKVEVEDEDMCDFEEYGVVPLSSSSTSSEEKSSKEKRVHEVVHLHFTDWPDFGTPVSTAPIYSLAQLASLLKQKGANRGVNGPITVHCSAGIGRAGTFIATHILLTKYTSMALNTATHTSSHVHTEAIPHINSPSHQSFPPRGHPIPPVSCVCSSPRLQPSTSAPAIHATSPTHNSTILSSSSPHSLQNAYSPSFTPIVTSLNSLNTSTTQLYIPSCPHDFSFTIKDVVRHLRTQRYGMVQTEDQYRFIYRVVAESIRAQNHNEILRRKSVEEDTLTLGGLVLNPFNNTKLDKSQPQSQLQPQPLTSSVTLTNSTTLPSPLSFANFFVPPPQNTLVTENMVIEEENTLKSSSISNTNNTNGKILVDLLSSRGVHTKTTK